jgi:hypothetical protein
VVQYYVISSGMDGVYQVTVVLTGPSGGGKSNMGEGIGGGGTGQQTIGWKWTEVLPPNKTGADFIPNHMKGLIVDVQGLKIGTVARSCHCIE